MLKFFKNNSTLIICLSWAIVMCSSQLTSLLGYYPFYSTMVVLFSTTFFVSLFYEISKMKKQSKIFSHTDQEQFSKLIFKNELMFTKEKHLELESK